MGVSQKPCFEPDLVLIRRPMCSRSLRLGFNTRNVFGGADPRDNCVVDGEMGRDSSAAEEFDVASPHSGALSPIARELDCLEARNPVP